MQHAHVGSRELIEACHGTTITIQSKAALPGTLVRGTVLSITILDDWLNVTFECQDWKKGGFDEIDDDSPWQPSSGHSAVLLSRHLTEENGVVQTEPTPQQASARLTPHLQLATA